MRAFDFVNERKLKKSTIVILVTCNQSILISGISFIFDHSFFFQEVYFIPT